MRILLIAAGLYPKKNNRPGFVAGSLPDEGGWADGQMGRWADDGRTKPEKFAWKGRNPIITFSAAGCGTALYGTGRLKLLLPEFPEKVFPAAVSRFRVPAIKYHVPDGSVCIMM